MNPTSILLALLLPTAGYLQEKSIDESIQALKDPDKEVRKKAGWTLCFKAAHAKAAVPTLKATLKDPDRDVRLICAIALTRIDPATVDVTMDHLIEALDAEKELWHRENAACSLAGSGKKVKPALAALTRALGASMPDPTKDRDGAEATIRLWSFSAVALGNLGAEAKDAVPALKKIAALDEKQVGNENTREAKNSAREALDKILAKDR